MCRVRACRWRVSLWLHLSAAPRPITDPSLERDGRAACLTEVFPERGRGLALSAPVPFLSAISSLALDRLADNIWTTNPPASTSTGTIGPQELLLSGSRPPPVRCVPVIAQFRPAITAVIP